jgi:hypothetical protein
MDTISILLPAIFILLGIFLFAFGQIQQRKAKVIESWPTISGIILASDLREHSSTDDDGMTSSTYEPVVEYSYRYMGSEYTSKQYRMGSKGTSYNHKRALAIIDRYPIDQNVNVRCNPDNPSQAVLELGSASASILMIVGGIFMSIGGILLVVFLFLV